MLEVLAELSPRELEFLAERAREDFVVFCGFVLRDELSNKPIRLAPLHVDICDAVVNHDHLNIKAHIESGKAVPLDTPIPTPRGWTTMGALSVGDEVFSSTGTVCRVTHKTEIQYDRKVYEVEFDDGDIVRADAEHQWSAWSVDDLVAGRPRRVVTTEEMASRVFRVGGAGKQYKWKIPLAEPVQYPARDLPVHPYVLGAWLGNGDSDDPSLTFDEKDRSVFDRCIELEGGDIEPTRDKRRPNVMHAPIGLWENQKWDRDSNNLRYRFRALGVLNNKHIPAIYLMASEEQRRELLAGLLDTDGYLAQKGGGASQIEYSSCRRELGEGVLELARSLGFKARMKVQPSKLYGRVVGTRYRVFFTAREHVFRLQRQRDKTQVGWLKTRARYRCVVRISPVDSVPVQCIAVDSADHTYLMGKSYTVTHNTALLSIGYVLWRLGRDRNLRIVVVQNTRDQARKIIRAVRRYIEDSDELAMVFPHLRPAAPWMDDGIVVERDVVSKDFSFQSLGVHGNIMGARIDVLILDDILDYENTLTPLRREDTWRWVTSTPFSRLTEHSQVINVSNAWHPDDVTHRLQKNPMYRTLVYEVLDEKGVPRWPERWPLSRIEKTKQNLLGDPAEFLRALFCRAREEQGARFRKEWIERAMKRGDGRDMTYSFRVPPPGVRVYCGVDLAVRKSDSADWTSFQVIAIHPNGDRELLYSKTCRIGGPEIVKEVLDLYWRFNCIFVVENVGAQDYVIQFVHESMAVPIIPYSTGTSSPRLEFEVEKLATEMGNGKWIIPNRSGNLHPEVERVVNAMLLYDPKDHTPDELASLCFARHAAGAVPDEAGTLDLDTTAR